ncbi:hypothetical protein MNBD_ALPHA07-1926 [hydrothermal vent metagenome]|uniref:Peptidase S8/S53 domain-containing protein n=1 Tax=hydrothermal vent metagenome TaxID=652676 RepID=A0A3B0S708_9ZZZZ
MRFLVLLLMLLWPGTSMAEFRITTAGCVSPGASLTITGRSFSKQPTGKIMATSGVRREKLTVKSWSSKKIRVTLPRQGLKLGDTYTVSWDIIGANDQLLGDITICTTAAPNRTRAARDVVPAPDGSPEYMVFVATNQAQAARNALQAQGATLLRTRTLRQLGRTMLFFSFPGNLSLERARSLLGNSAPGAVIDQHNIYGLSQGARLYAPAMIGDDPGRVCKLRRAVRVGLIDGPVNKSHPALAGVFISRKSVLAEGERPARVDHGTAVAGIIAGQPTGGSLAGFAIGAKIYAAEAFANIKGRTGARLENVAVGIDWLLGQKVQIVNLSMSGSTNQAFASLLSRARAKGMIMVAAAGNEGTSKLRYPAGSPDTIAVTAVDAAGRVYRKANSGKHIEFAAPGVDLYAAKGNGGGYLSGTSYAAPIVAALLARQSARGGLSLPKARANLRRGVRDLGPAGRDTKYGFGLVQSGGC